jgi:predicted aspartyl protease
VNAGPAEWFCLDSGAPHSVIDPRLARKLNLRTFEKGSIIGTGSGKVDMAHSEAVTLALGKITLKVAEPWVIDLSGVPIPNDVRGLMGADLFKAYVVRIDPLAKQLQLFDPKGYSPGDAGTSLPLHFDDDKLTIDLTLDVKPGLSVTHRVRIDTGAEESVSDPIVAQSEETRKTTLGNGLGANFEALSGVFAAVHIGPYTIRHVWGPGAPQVTIGMEMLRRFTTTFDTQRGVLHLIPNRTLIEPVPEPGA